MSYDLRPLSLGELLDRAFSLYRRHLLLFVGIMAPPAVALLIANVVLQVLDFAIPSDVEADSDQLAALILGGVGMLFLMAILYFVGYAIALGATTFAVAEIYKGESATVRHSYGAMRGRIGRLTWLLFLVGIRIFGATVLALAGTFGMIAAGSAIHPVVAVVFLVLFAVSSAVGVIWLMLRYSVAVPPAVLEDMTARESIRRSIQLTAGNRFRVGLLLFFVFLVSYAALMLFQWPFLIAAVIAGPESAAGFWLSLTGGVTGTLASMVTTPLTVVAFAVLYYDLRIRKEGLDLEILIAGLRESAVPRTAGANPSGVVFPN